MAAVSSTPITRPGMKCFNNQSCAANRVIWQLQVSRILGHVVKIVDLGQLALSLGKTQTIQAPTMATKAPIMMPHTNA